MADLSSFRRRGCTDLLKSTRVNASGYARQKPSTIAHISECVSLV